MTDHRLFAAAYDRMLARSETRGLADRRRRLLASARGRILEVGAGTGLNVRHYRPEQVSSLTVLEPDGAMRRRLAARVAAAALPVELMAAGIDDAALPDAGFDTVVATLVFCSVADPGTAAAAVHRWLKPGGRLLFLEHVRAVGLRGVVQHAVTPLWSLAAGGCHLDRETLDALRGAGLVVSDCERFALPAGGPLLKCCVQGVAWRRPVGDPVAPAPDLESEGAP